MVQPFPNLQSPLSQSPLMQLLAQMNQMGLQQKAAVGPALGQGLEQMLRGFERQGDIRRQHEFAAGEADTRRAFERRMAADERSVSGARERRRQQFEAAQAAKGRDFSREQTSAARIAEEIAGLDRMLNEIAVAIDSSPPGTDTSRLMARWTALNERRKGLGGDGGPPPVPPPGAGPALGRVFSTNVEPTAREEAEAAAEAAKMSPPIIRTSPYTVRNDSGFLDGPSPMKGFVTVPALPADDPRLAGLAKSIRASENAIQWLKGRPVQDDDIKRRIAREEGRINEARTAMARSGAHIAQERVVREIGSEARDIFAPGGTPRSPKAILYKTVLADIENGETDEGRLVSRATDRMTDRGFAVSAGLDKQKPTPEEIRAFIRVAMARTGRGNR